MADSKQGICGGTALQAESARRTSAAMVLRLQRKHNFWKSPLRYDSARAHVRLGKHGNLTFIDFRAIIIFNNLA
jgi:hypothetical protein